MRRLVRAFVVSYMEKTVVKHAPCNISIFYLVSIAKQTGLSLTWSQNSKTGFLVTGPYLPGYASCINPYHAEYFVY